MNLGKLSIKNEEIETEISNLIKSSEITVFQVTWGKESTKKQD